MRVKIVKPSEVIKSFDVWREDPEKSSKPDIVNFSYELLKELRDTEGNPDIREVRELLALGADPNYKLLGHTDEELVKKSIEMFDWDETQYVARMELKKWCTLAIAIFMQSMRPDIIEEMLLYKADPNLDLMEIGLKYHPTAFFLSATTNTKNIEDHERILDAFVKKGANVNVTNLEGNNVIHECVIHGLFGIIPKLIELGVDRFHRNERGELPYDLLDETVIDAFSGMSHKRHDDSPEMQVARKVLMPKIEKKRGFFDKK
jgi:hypothetical protein